MSLRPSRRAMLAAFIAGFVLHTLTAFFVWRTWGEFGRSNVLAWMDFPTSLAYMELDGSKLLAWSLGAGGLQWGLIAAGLTFLLGRSVRWQG